MGGAARARGRRRSVQAQEVRHGGVPLPELASARGARTHVHHSRRACAVPAHARVQRAVSDGVPLHGHAHPWHGKARAGRRRRAARGPAGPVRRARRGSAHICRSRQHSAVLSRGDKGGHGGDGVLDRLAPRVHHRRPRVQEVRRVADSHAARDGAHCAGIAPRRVVPKGQQPRLAARHAGRRRARLYRVHPGKVQARWRRGRPRGPRDPRRDAAPRDLVRRDKPVGRSRRRVRARCGLGSFRAPRGGGGRGRGRRVDRLGRVRAQARVPWQEGRAEGDRARLGPCRAHGRAPRRRHRGRRAARPSGALCQAGDGHGAGHVGARACAVRLARPRGPQGGRRRGGPCGRGRGRGRGAAQDHRVRRICRLGLPGGRCMQAARRQEPGRRGAARKGDRRGVRQGVLRWVDGGGRQRQRRRRRRGRAGKVCGDEGARGQGRRQGVAVQGGGGAGGRRLRRVRAVPRDHRGAGQVQVRGRVRRAHAVRPVVPRLWQRGVEEERARVPLAHEHTAQGDPRRVRQRGRLASRARVRQAARPGHQPAVGRRLDSREPVRLGHLHGVLYDIGHGAVGGAARRAPHAGVLRLCLPWHGRKGRGRQDSPRDGGRRGRGPPRPGRVCVLLPRRREALGPRPGAEPSDVLRHEPHGGVRQGELAARDRRQRVRPDGRQEDVKEYGQHHTAPQGRARARGRRDTACHTRLGRALAGRRL